MAGFEIHRLTFLFLAILNELLEFKSNSVQVEWLALDPFKRWKQSQHVLSSNENKSSIEAL